MKPGMKICERCGKEKGFRCFRRGRARKNHAVCNQCDDYLKKRNSGYFKKSKNQEQKDEYKRNNPLKVVCSAAKGRATKNNIPFNISSDYLEGLWTGKCACCGVDIEYGTNDRKHQAQLDRSIPSVGYVKGNVAFLCKTCNMIKSDACWEEVEAVYNYMKGL